MLLAKKKKEKLFELQSIVQFFFLHILNWGCWTDYSVPLCNNYYGFYLQLCRLHTVRRNQHLPDLLLEFRASLLCSFYMQICTQQNPMRFNGKYFFMEWNLSGSFRLQKFKIKMYLRLWLNHPFHTLLHLQIINLTHRIVIAAVSVYWSFLILLLLCLIIISLCCTIVLALCTESIQFSGVSLSLFVALN